MICHNVIKAVEKYKQVKRAIECDDKGVIFTLYARVVMEGLTGEVTFA